MIFGASGDDGECLGHREEHRIGVLSQILAVDLDRNRARRAQCQDWQVMEGDDLATPRGRAADEQAPQVVAGPSVPSRRSEKASSPVSKDASGVGSSGRSPK